MIFTEKLYEVIVAGYNSELTMKREQWCKEYYGEYGGKWMYAWDSWAGDSSNICSIWSFVNSDDAAHFSLRWS